MKKLFILLSALWVTVAAQARDNIVVKNVEVPQGGTATVEVEFNNPDHTFTAFQMALQLPEGISGVLNDKGKLDIVNGDRFDDHGLSSSVITGGFQLACLSNTTAAIEGTSGVLFSFDVQADAALQVGAELTAKFTGIAFTTTGQAVEVTLDDASFVITIGEPDDGRLHFDETSTKLPTYTADKGDVTLKRTIKADTWSTIVLPFKLTKAKAEEVFGNDVHLAEFSGFEVDYGDDEENVTPLGITINFATYTMSAKKGMTGGKPFLIKTSKDISVIEADKCSLVNAVSDVTKETDETDEFKTSGKFTGTFTKTTVPADGLFLNSNKFYYSTGKSDIKAFRGWFELGAVLNKETDFGVKMVIDGLETKVEGIGVKDAAGNVYDLNGRKVSKAQKGVYIVNGKKVFVK